MSSRDLFGAFITATVPLHAIDLSDDPSWLQEVPDSQEVFRYNKSNAIIVIEVLQKVQPQDGDAPVRVVFDSLAPAGAAGTVDDSPEIQIQRNDSLVPILLTGTQYIAKNDRRPDQLDQVRVALGLFNTVDQHNDLAVSFTVPISYSGSRDEETESVTWDQAKDDFVELVTSLTIKPGLFKAPSDSW